MMVMGFSDIDGHHAAVGDLAILVLKLDRGVVDAKLVGETFVEFAQYGIAR